MEACGSLSHKGVLARGYALVLDDAGQPVRARAGVTPGMPLDVVFTDGAVRVIAAGDVDDAPAVRRTARRRKTASPEEAAQPTLFGGPDPDSE